jgi:choline-sulfatase
VDEQIGALLAALKRHGVERDTIVILTSDHGEAFLEHRFVHHREVYEPLLHVPLIVHDPRAAGGRRLPAAVTLEDVAVTLVAFAGAKVDAALDGRALPTSPSTQPARSHFAYYRYKPEEGYEAYALYRGALKLVHHRLGGQLLADELYDLSRDPQERFTMPLDSPEARTMRGEIETRLGSARTGSRMERDEATIKELCAMGYIEEADACQPGGLRAKD